jgi:glutaminyl-tRNA synthetase
MADAITEATAKLLLDEETGEMVSKNELKKRLQKRAKKASKAAAASDPSKKVNDNKAVAPKKPKPEETQPVSPQVVFEGGFLARVYDERPVGNATITRFPPEPNGL